MKTLLKNIGGEREMDAFILRMQQKRRKRGGLVIKYMVYYKACRQRELLMGPCKYLCSKD